MNKIEQKYCHIPVLLNEAIGFLKPRPGGNFIDGTLGGGGYSRKILELIGEKGKLLSIDLDKDAVSFAEIQKLKLGFQNWILHRGNFRNIDEIAGLNNFSAPDGIVADLGMSSNQLDNSSRGISFQKEEMLDMRFDTLAQEQNAKEIVNKFSEKVLGELFWKYGEEKFFRQIAREIGRTREKKEIKTTFELFEIIKSALPKPVKHKASDSARRIFQALRIEVNNELESLNIFLPKAFELLKSGGRLVVVSFHSLEDRIVKHFFQSLEKGCLCSPELPECVCGKKPVAKLLAKKPVIASDEEIYKNPRSKPAKLRGVVKL